MPYKMVLAEENKYMSKKEDEAPDESKEESKKSKKGKKGKGSTAKKSKAKEEEKKKTEQEEMYEKYLAEKRELAEKMLWPEPESKIFMNTRNKSASTLRKPPRPGLKQQIGDFFGKTQVGPLE